MIGMNSLKCTLNLLRTGHPHKPKSKPDESMGLMILFKDVLLKVFIIGEDDSSFPPCQAKQSNIIELTVSLGYP